MSVLILPGRGARGQRPSGPVVLNRESPQAVGLVAWWPLGSAGWLEMISGKAPTAIGSGVPELQSGAIGGMVYSGDGGGAGTAGDWLDVSNVSLASVTTQATLAFWVRLRAATPATSLKTGFPVCLQAMAGGNASHYPWGDGTAYVSTLRANGTRQTITLSSAVDRTQWHLVAISTKNGASNWRFSQNGSVIHSAAGEASVTFDASAIWLGATDIETTNHQYGLDGQLADVRVWDRALSDAEVWALYDPATRWDLYWVPGRKIYFDTAAAPAGGVGPLIRGGAVRRSALLRGGRLTA